MNYCVRNDVLTFFCKPKTLTPTKVGAYTKLAATWLSPILSRSMDPGFRREDGMELMAEASTRFVYDEVHVAT